MDVAARSAVPADLPELERLYRLLEAEMTALEPVWGLSDGTAEPAAASLRAAIESDDATVLVGTIDGVPFGFLVGSEAALLPQAGGERAGSVRLIYTEPDAREVGVGEAMLAAYLEAAADAGIVWIDAHVTPGQRFTKNFFESKGFSARSIVMHRSEGSR